MHTLSHLGSGPSTGTRRLVLWAAVSAILLGLACSQSLSQSSILISPAGILDARAVSAGGLPNPEPSNLAQKLAVDSRTRTPTVTATPTPMRVPSVPTARRAASGPRSAQGVPVLDANTIALFHFDSANGNLVPDATGNYQGVMQGGASILAQGLYGGDLQIPTGGSMAISNFADMSQGTIEAFVDFSTACPTMGNEFTIFSAGPNPANGQMTMQVGQHYNGLYNTLYFSILTSDGWKRVDTNVNTCRYLTGGYPDMPWPYDVWRFHHLAMTWGPRGMEVWIDGVLHAEGTQSPYIYTCNPQSQSFGGAWPLCPFPTYMATPVPGTYVGGLGLPANSTLLVGGFVPIVPAELAAIPFNGRVDEMRISNVQRTFDISVDPTSTPTVTMTPVQLSSGEYQVDSNTLALYHLNVKLGNEVVNEVNGLLSFAGDNTTLVPGRFNSALAYGSSSSAAQTGDVGGPANGTVEAWVNLSSVPGTLEVFGVKQFYNSQDEELQLGADWTAGGTVRFGIAGNWADSGVNASALIGAWHHVAGTWGARGLEIWIDGRLCRGNSYTGAPTNPMYTYLFGCGSVGKCMVGAIDEVRVSNIQRVFSPIRYASVPARSGAYPTSSARIPQTDFWSFLPLIGAVPTPSALCGQ